MSYLTSLDLFVIETVSGETPQGIGEAQVVRLPVADQTQDL
jgi:hypothetical protein